MVAAYMFPTTCIAQSIESKNPISTLIDSTTSTNTTTVESAVATVSTVVSGFTCLMSLGNFVVCGMLINVAIYDAIVTCYQTKKDTDEIKEGDNLFLISRRPMDFSL
jgi:hypothetical protein